MPRRSVIFKILIEIISAILIILWVYTGVHKYLDYEKFSIELTRSPFIEKYAAFVSYTLPAGELLLALLLIIPLTRLIGLYLSFFVMAMFTGYVYIMLSYAPDLPCTCGGIIEKLTWDQHLFVNAAITVLTVVAILLKVTINSYASAKDFETKNIKHILS